MRTRIQFFARICSVLIVMTLGGLPAVFAVQSFSNTAHRLNPVRKVVQDSGSATETLQDAATVQVEPKQAPDEQKPEVFIEDRFAGWQAAGTGTKAARLSDELRANWVMVDDNGLLAGQVLGLKTPEEIEKDKQAREADQTSAGFDNEYAVSTDGATEGQAATGRPGCCGGKGPGDANNGLPTGTFVYLLQRGRMLGSARLDADNRFKFQGVKPGNYALVGYGQGGFFAIGFDVIPFSENSNQASELYIPAIASNGKTVTDWVTSNAPNVHFRQFGDFRFGQGKDDPPRLFGITGLRTFSPQASPATTVVSHPAGLSADGRLLGRLHNINSSDGRPLDLRTTTVQLYHEGKLVQQTGTDNYGVFEFSDVEPGSYEVRAAGPDGIGAIQIEVVAADDAQGKPIDMGLTSPETIGWINHFMHETAYMEAISGPRPESRCDRCGQKRCPHCGGCGCQGHGCQCGGYGWNSNDGYGNYGGGGY